MVTSISNMQLISVNALLDVKDVTKRKAAGFKHALTTHLKGLFPWLVTFVRGNR